MTEPPATHLRRIGPLRQTLGLLALEIRRGVRGWRWRGLMLLMLAGAYVADRVASFGEGSAARFPGGVPGVMAFSVLTGFAGLLFGSETIGQLDRQRARRPLEARGYPPASLQVARLVAATTCSVAAAMVPLVFPFFSPLFGGDLPLVAPSAWFLLTVLLPCAFAGAGAGILARSFLPNDAAGLAAGAALLYPTMHFRMVVAMPADIFLLTSSQLGVLVPRGTMVMDGLLTAAPGLLCVVVGFALGRRVIGRTPLRGLAPPKLAHLPSMWRSLRFVRRVCSLSPGTLLLGAVCGLPALAGLLAAWPADVLPEPRPDWTRMVEPPGAPRGTVLPPRITSRRMVLPPDPAGEILVQLGLASYSAVQQSLAGVTFGPAMRVTSLDRDRGTVLVEPRATNAASLASVWRFEPPLEPDTPTTVTVRLRPTPDGMRHWRKGFHPIYASLAQLPQWWGEGVQISYAFNDFIPTRQTSPYDLVAPGVDPSRVWVAGAAISRQEGGRAVIHQQAPGSPAGLFASRFVTVPYTLGALDLKLLVLPENRELAQQWLVIHGDQLDRLRRAFGKPRVPIILYEVPFDVSIEQTSLPPEATQLLRLRELQPVPTSDPMAIPSTQITEMRRLLPDFNDLDEPTAPRFDELFRPQHRGIVRHLVETNFDGFEYPGLLRDSFIEYLSGSALLDGNYRDLAKKHRRDFTFLPWEWVNSGDRYLFDLTEAEANSTFRNSSLLQLERAGADSATRQLRRLAVHHMLRGVLGDEAYARFISRLFVELRGERLTLASFRGVAEEVHGSSLAWFFEEWVDHGVIPRYTIMDVRAILYENKATRNLEYRTHLVVANEGTGRMPVPIALQTEGDVVRQIVWLDAGEEKALDFVTPARPIAATIDPEGWIVQLPPFSSQAKHPLHPQVFIKAVKEI